MAAFRELKLRLLADKSIKEIRNPPLPPKLKAETFHPKPTRKVEESNYVLVDPKTISAEDGVYSKNGRYFKKFETGGVSRFHLLPGFTGPDGPSKTSTLLCRGKLDEWEKLKGKTLQAREEEVTANVIQRNRNASLSALRKEELRQFHRPPTFDTTTEPLTDELEAAGAALILKNASDALIDNEPEMREFYSSVASAQVLAMQKKQMEDNIIFKKMGLRNLNAYNQVEETEDTTEYADMKRKKQIEREKNLATIEVMAKQVEEKNMLKDLEMSEMMTRAQLTKEAFQIQMLRLLKDKENEEKLKEKERKEFLAILEYNDYLKKVKHLEDKNIAQRENDFLQSKSDFDRQFEEKRKGQKKIDEDRVAAAQELLRKKLTAREEEEMKYYYVIQHEANEQLEKRERSEKQRKVDSIFEFIKDVDRVTKRNEEIRAEIKKRDKQEYQDQMKVLAKEKILEDARKQEHVVLKDMSRMEIMAQIKDNERKRRVAQAEKQREAKMLNSTEFVRLGKVKQRMTDVIRQSESTIPQSTAEHFKLKYELDI